MVSKRPTRDAQHLLAVQTGNRDRGQLAFDFSVP